MAARVIVYLFTYKRAVLLERALRSLLAQTFTDWVCELHNDAPEDGGPRDVLERLGADPRVRLVNHAENLGGVRSFSLAFVPSPHAYSAILEDDNWWEPRFLECLVGELDRRPEVAMATANMRKWQEMEDGSWQDTGAVVWPREELPHDALAPFDWRRETTGQWHSNGAMVFRTLRDESMRFPAGSEFTFIECFQARAFPHPFLRVQEPLANFAITRGTARKMPDVNYGQTVMALITTALRIVRPPLDELRAHLDGLRSVGRRGHLDWLVAALSDGRCRYALRAFRPSDWVVLGLLVAKRPWRFRGMLRYRRDQREAVAYLEKFTALRVAEQGAGATPREKP